MKKWCTECGAKSKKAHHWNCSRSKKYSKAYPAIKEKVVKKPKIKETDFLLLLDRSGSMGIHGQYPAQVVNEQIASVRQASYDSKINTRLVVAQFDSIYEKLADHKSILQPYIFGQFVPRGATNLFESFVKLAKEARPDVPVTLLVITDGEHNSGVMSQKTFKNFVDDLQATGRFTLAVIGPPGMVSQLKYCGFHPGNLKVWDGTTQELRIVSAQSVRSLGNQYVNNYTSGLMSTNCFFEANVKNTKDISSLPVINCTQAFVNKPTDISNFARDVFGGYSAGNVFYELTKPETVQSYKKLLVMDRSTGQIKGGDQDRLRNAVGIPVGKDAKVVPGNLKGFKLFVQSTSVNRKLIPGTTVVKI